MPAPTPASAPPPCARHAEVRGQSLRLRFRAKSGVERDMRLTDRALARFVRKMQDLPGQHLFQYLDERLRLPGRFGRRQRLAARGDRRGLHRQAFPHLACERAGLCRTRSCAGRRAARPARACV
jgi:hypothetical protein